jgi:hypothetical protein
MECYLVEALFTIDALKYYKDINVELIAECHIHVRTKLVAE